MSNFACIICTKWKDVDEVIYVHPRFISEITEWISIKLGMGGGSAQKKLSCKFNFDSYGCNTTSTFPTITNELPVSQRLVVGCITKYTSHQQPLLVTVQT